MIHTGQKLGGRIFEVVGGSARIESSPDKMVLTREAIFGEKVNI